VVLLAVILGATTAASTPAGNVVSFKGEVTWVQGARVKIGSNYVPARGGPGFKSLNLKKYALRPGETIKVTGQSTAQFYVTVGSSSAYCELDPTQGVVQVNPSGTVLLRFTNGSSTCGALTGGRGCVQVSQNASVSFELPAAGSSICSQSSTSQGARALSTISASSQTRKAGSVFAVDVAGHRTVVGVQTGTLVVSAKTGQKRAVVVGAHAQTVVLPGDDPTGVSKIAAPPSASVVKQVQAPLPTVKVPAPPGLPTVQGPSSPSSLRQAQFTFAAAGTSLTYSCALDGSVFRLCTSPFEVTATDNGEPLMPGAHELEVEATDAAGRTGPVRPDRWVIDSSRIVFAYKTDAGNDQIYSMNSDGTDARNISQSNTDDYAPALSPDGTEVAFQRTDPATGDVNVFVSSIDGGSVRQVTNLRFAANPAWSPDGARLVFESTQTGHSELYEINTDGTGETQLTFDDATATRASWSPDGEQIAFASRSSPNAGYQLYLIPADGGHETPVMQDNCNCSELDPAWSTDSGTLAFDSRRDQQASRIYVINLTTHAITPVTTSPAGVSRQTQDSNPTWAPDGRSIAFQRLANGVNSIFVTGPDDGDRPIRITGGSGLPNEALVPSW
jgi:Tol biopolymer transport system component